MPFRIPQNYGLLAVRSEDPSPSQLAAYQLWLKRELALVGQLIDMMPETPKPPAEKGQEPS